MSFHSYAFLLLFLPITVIAYYGLNRLNNRLYGKLLLIVSALVFCGFYNPWYAVALTVSVLVNFFLALGLERSQKKGVLAAAVTVNLLSLGYFKYTGFFLSTVNTVFGTEITLVKILLPLGISFYTLSQIATLVDVYRGDLKMISRHGEDGPDKEFTRVNYAEAFVDYAVYATFFPKIVQGPIQSYRDFSLPVKGADAQTAFTGLYSIGIGLVKKLILADTLAAFVDRGYLSVTEMTPMEAWLVMLGYSLQLYFDFAGYCDMAVGAGMLFGVRLPENFNRPYNALGMQDFWARWHMTLTDFFRRYLYFPMGGSRKGKVRTYVNILVVFLVSGLWHGAAFTFIVWGLIHGIGNAFDHLSKKAEINVPKIILWPVTFLYVNIAWIFFRLDYLNRAWRMVKKLFSFRSLGDFAVRSDLSDKLILPGVQDFLSITGLNSTYFKHPGVFAGIFVATALLLALLPKPVRSHETKPTAARMIICVVLFVWGLCSVTGVTTFLYAFF